MNATPAPGPAGPESPSSGAPAAVPFRGRGPFLAKAPPFWLPMRHFVFAAASFWVFAAAFLWGNGRLLGFDFDARWVLGLTHTLTLGWVAMTLFGAMCQLAPVLWETSLASERAAAAAWWLLAAGAAAFVGALWSGSEGYWLGASLAASGVTLYLYVLAKTMLAAAKLDWTGKHLALGLVYLVALAGFGVALAYDRQRAILFRDPEGALIAHVHLALVGWVSLSIMGVSYRLVSMFALSHLSAKTPGRLALALANIGLLGLTLDAGFLGRRLMPVWASLLTLAYVAYAFQLRRIFSERNRRIDPALAFTLLALAGGAAWAALGVGLAFGWVADSTEARLAYVSCALLGWATPFILGQIHKIVPFLVWLHVYSPRSWTPPVVVPKIQDLTSERVAWLELAALAGAMVLTPAGFLTESQALLRAGAILLLSCATLYGANTALTLSHVIRRDARWTPPSA
ncbi:MAG: hypothetical protein HY553_17595 [Elusimicrobia bacterium]|nr:hypothetical protein [Elusimicrobiota bacterium]